MEEEEKKKNSIIGPIKLTVFGLLLIALLVWLISIVPQVEVEDLTNEEENSEEVTVETNKLLIEDLQEGEGVEAKPGDTVSVHYVGTLTTGEKFDSSRDRGEPFSFELGAGRVIRGWDQGVAGMKVGGIRKLTIPPELAYGERGAPPAIGPNTILVFEVELLEIE